MSDQAKTPVLLDVRGLNCPLPVLKAKKAMKALAPGDHLRIEATDPLAAVDVPHFCTEDGHRLVSQDKANGIQVFVVEKGC